MNFVKQIRVGQEGAETGFRAEIDDPPFVFGAREIGRIGIAEHAPTEGNELFLSFGRTFRLLHRMNPTAGTAARAFYEWAGWTFAINTSYGLIVNPRGGRLVSKR